MNSSNGNRRMEPKQLCKPQHPGRHVHSTLQRCSHPGCFVCASANGNGLGLQFELTPCGVVEASFACQAVFEGYPDMLHGGIICTLLDGAMTNCLFAHGDAAVTAELKVRFRHPVNSLRPLHELAAELVQEQQVMATANAKFLERTAPPESNAANH